MSSSGLYLHVDLDSIDPAEGTANRYAAPGGLSRADLVMTFDIIAQSGHPVVAAAVTAYDPAFDSGRKMASTAEEVIVEILECFAEC